jgi:hypothetical protein
MLVSSEFAKPPQWGLDATRHGAKLRRRKGEELKKAGRGIMGGDLSLALVCPASFFSEGGRE